MATPGIRSVETQGDPVMAVVHDRPGGRAEGEAEPEPDQEQGSAVDEEAIDDEAAARAEGGAEDDAEAGSVDPAITRPAMMRFEAGAIRGTPPKEDAYSLRLVSGRRLYDNGTLIQHSPHLAPLAKSAPLLVNPSDLDRLGLPDGGRLRLHGAGGTLTVDSRPDAGVPKGSVYLAFNLPGEQAAELIDATSPVTDVRLETI
jgi:anaerobic selenocysteine-containing dehydrogenase